jgi:hypothetical protein
MKRRLRRGADCVKTSAVRRPQYSFANHRRKNVQQYVQRFVQQGPLLDLQVI